MMRLVAMRILPYLVAVLALLITGAVMFSRTSRYPAGYDMLLPDAGCNPPCVLGIQPGVTTLDEAAARLQANPAVTEVASWAVETEGYSLRWRWRDGIPADINGSRAYASDDQIIQWVSIQTTMPLSTIRRHYGEPESIAIFGTCFVGTFIELYGGTLEIFYDTVTSSQMPTYRTLLNRPVRINVASHYEETTSYRAATSYQRTAVIVDTPTLMHRQCRV